MRSYILATAVFAALAATITCARADMVGAAVGTGTGLLVAGPPGAVVGGVIGAVWGKPFWGPPISRSACGPTIISTDIAALTRIGEHIAANVAKLPELLCALRYANDQHPRLSSSS